MRFGAFELDYASAELRSNGRRVALQGQPAQVLGELVRNRGQIVTRQELRRAIWPADTFVEFDTALNVAINKVRQALNDSATSPRFIETVPKRGYRFLADVQAVQASVPPAEPLAARRPSASLRARWLTLGAALALTAGEATVWRSDRTVRPSAPPRSVAILPFKPLAGGAADEALQAGMAEAMIVRLSELKHLRIPSLSTVQRHASRDRDPLAAGRALGVEAVLDGTLLRLDGNLRVSARLLAVEGGTTLWAQQWDLPWTDVFAVQDAMASQVLRALALSLASEEQAALRKRPTSVAAYERYLRARHLLARFSEPKRAAELLEEAVRIDPGSAAAHSSLAFAYVLIPLGEGPVKPYVSLSRQSALRALELDPALAEAHAVLGRISYSFDWDLEAAERKMRKALEFDSDDPFTLHCFSTILAQEGRFEESLGLNQRLLDQDPVATLPNRDRAVILYLARRYPEAVEQSRKALELDPNFPPTYSPLWRTYERLGRPQETIEAYVASLGFLRDEQANVPALREAARRGGLEGFWKRRLEQLLARPEPPAYSVARAYMSLGNRERALAWLEKLSEQGGAFRQTLKLYPDWDPLRGDARFQSLLRRANVDGASGRSE